MAIRLHQVQIELTTPQHTLQSAWPENNLTTQATRSPPAPPLTLDKRPRPHSAFQLAPMSYCVPERVAAVLSYNLAIHQNSRLHCRLPACPPALKQTQTMLQVLTSSIFDCTSPPAAKRSTSTKLDFLKRFFSAELAKNRPFFFFFP